MFNDTIKWFLRMSMIGIFWVFLLSVSIDGRTMFSYANGVLVQNPIVEYVDGQLADLWDKISETARITFSEMGEVDKKA